ncbi:hypothetical protein Ancab_005714 [Ancistrocladus abbreviatus]
MGGKLVLITSDNKEELKEFIEDGREKFVQFPFNGVKHSASNSNLSSITGRPPRSQGSVGVSEFSPMGWITVSKGNSMAIGNEENTGQFENLGDDYVRHEGPIVMIQSRPWRERRLKANSTHIEEADHERRRVGLAYGDIKKPTEMFTALNAEKSKVGKEH